MPTYEYFCEHCGEFEEFHSTSDDAKLKHCPMCAKEGRGEAQPVQRLIGGGSGRGIVNLTVDEFKATLPGEVRKVYERGAKEEKFADNFLGGGLYEKSLKIRGR